MFSYLRRRKLSRLYARLEACQKAADDAKARRDTRDIHKRLIALREARHAVMAVEFRA